MTTLTKITLVSNEIEDVLCVENNTIRIAERSETVEVDPIDIDAMAVNPPVVIHVEL